MANLKKTKHAPVMFSTEHLNLADNSSKHALLQIYANSIKGGCFSNYSIERRSQTDPHNHTPLLLSTFTFLKEGGGACNFDMEKSAKTSGEFLGRSQYLFVTTHKIGPYHLFLRLTIHFVLETPHF